VNELESICDASRTLSSAGEASWLATVVRVRGSAYRRAGARLLFTREAVVAGSVSAGCIETELVRKGSWYAAERATLRTFEADAPDDGDERHAQGSGCGGSVDVLIEPNRAACSQALSFIQSALANQETVAIATVVRSGSRLAELGARLVSSNTASVSSGSALELEGELALLTRLALASPVSKPRSVRRGVLELLIEVVEPAPHLFVFGAGSDTVPLATFAIQLGWQVTVVTPRDRPSARERFAKLCRYGVCSVESAIDVVNQSARPLAVVMSHDYSEDRDALGALLASRARYVGVLGPLQRTQRLIYDLERAGCRHALGALTRIHAPVGLSIGAETPTEIALSIVAEAQATLRGAGGRSLAEHSGPIHAKERPTPELRLVHAEAAE
jgi:xanthine dehydrogenase accessory factor